MTDMTCHDITVDDMSVYDMTVLDMTVHDMTVYMTVGHTILWIRSLCRAGESGFLWLIRSRRFSPVLEAIPTIRRVVNKL
jgi:uncharacterized protein (DUF1499 family)